MRIIAGEWRGRPLLAPAGAKTRPTADRAREGVFSMLTSRLGSFGGLRVADLFAGTGALGLEALSRGAAYCLFVDNDVTAARTLRQNVERLRADQRCDIRTSPAQTLPAPAEPFDIVFLDPPYNEGYVSAVLPRLASGGWLNPGAFLSIETDKVVEDIPEGLEFDSGRSFGKARITLLRALA